MYDGLGSIVGLTDNAGAVANTYNYDPYGNETSSTGTAPNYFRYVAGYWAKGDVLHFGERWYDPGDRSLDPARPC